MSKIVALVPTRGDRHKMLANMHRLMSLQTLPLYGMVVFDDPPVNPNEKDITYRYSNGLKRVFEQYPDCELVALIEDDDYYSATYLETMYNKWIEHGRPSTFGMGDTYYYHIGINAWHHQIHKERSSAFTTFMTREVMDWMRWPAPTYSFVDIDIWRQFPGPTIIVNPPLAIGIKGHCEGAHFGGMGHNDKWATYAKRHDPDQVWLSQYVDSVSLEFYRSLKKQ